MADYSGLRVLWPQPGKQLLKHDHDIVFVHGLHSGPVSDWQDEDHVFWPVDFLARDVEHTRILSFGYDQERLNIRHDTAYDDQSIFNHGEALCSDLKDSRSLARGQPSITFIGHGTGGIVVKSALCYSHARKSQFGSILDKTKHVIFLDTPHQGINADAWRSISRGTLSESSQGQWKLWSLVLQDLRQTFAEIAVRFNVTSACASLTHRPRGFEDEVVPGDSGLTHLRHEHRLVLHGKKHLTISKFSERDTNYERLLRRIKVGRTCFTKDERDVKRIRTWLNGGVEGQSQSSVLNARDKEECLERHHPGTCEWLFQRQEFRDWAYKPDANRLLWLTAPVGTGKSVLCSVAAQRIAEMDSRPATPHIMVTYKKERSKCLMAHLLATQLLDHVLASADGIDTDVLPLLIHDANDTKAVGGLIRLLVAQCPAVFFFVDGLNELPLADAATSAGRRDELERLQADLQGTLGFLSQLARDTAQDTNVRLWCSSQRTEAVVSLMRGLGPAELDVDEKSVAHDVRRYLAGVADAALTRLSEPVDKQNAVAGLHRGAGSNFRWAFMMERSLAKCRTSKNLVETVEKGLPGTLGETYAARLEELKGLDDQDQREGRPPLSINTLSLLAFARRPLKASEVAHALSILDNPLAGGGCEDVTGRNLIDRGCLLHRCAPLVDFVPSPSDRSDGYLLLSHGSVFEFLHGAGRPRKGKRPQPSPASNVSPSTMAEACLKYLSQERYSTPLKKLSTQEFQTGSEQHPEPVGEQHFLQYAAKYWYRHLEEVGAEWFDRVKAFVLSRQFITAIQVQSLFVVGHFIDNFDSPDSKRRLMKQNLPGWFEGHAEGSSIVRCYDAFFREWSRFLRLGVTDCLNGEVDKCFWGALGPGNFLSRRGAEIESNRSFLLATEPSLRECAAAPSCRFYETISEDGTRLALWRAVPDSQGDAPSGQLRLEREAWYLDGQRPPFLYGRAESVAVAPDLVGWRLFDPKRSLEFPLIPARDDASRPPPIGEGHFGFSARIGALEFSRQRGRWTPDIPPYYGETLPYWEDILSQGDYIVRSRRAVVEEGYTTTAPGPEGGSGRPGAGASRADDGSEDGRSDSDPDSNFGELVSLAEEYSASASSEPADSAEEQATGAACSSDEEGDDAAGRDETPAESETESRPSRSGTRSSAESDAGTDPTSRSDAVSEPGRPDSDPDPDDGSDADGESSDTDAGPEVGAAPAKDLFSLFMRMLAGNSYRSSCDKCGQDVASSAEGFVPRPFYQCKPCGRIVSYDLCPACFDNGAWCLNRHHKMDKVIDRDGQAVVLGTVHPSEARLATTIVVERRGPGGAEPVFRYHTRKSAMLHGSPPALHPSLPLLVYPVDGRRLLFADLARNTYFTLRIPFDGAETGGAGGPAPAPVSVSVRPSACGRLVHVARVTARPPAAPGGPTPLFLQLVTVALSPQDPCQRLPRALPRRRGIALGRWPSALVGRLPFALTWTDAALFVSLSRLWLLVFRIPLPTPGGERQPRGGAGEDDDAVLTPSGRVPLPRSARSRPVHFFPAAGGRAAKLVLGSLYGARPEPPAVVYLGAESLGAWVPATEAVLTTAVLRVRKDARLEEFDEDSDCDLRIPLLDYQR